MTHKFDADKLNLIDGDKIGNAIKIINKHLHIHDTGDLFYTSVQILLDNFTAAHKAGMVEVMQGNRSIKAALDEEFKRWQKLMQDKCENIASVASEPVKTADSTKTKRTVDDDYGSETHGDS